ncbi:hypothetical protein EPUS_01015 [Endocarpon pusillum Z07020]|uniref:Uncharacterized protein n=1 Tax=Endocarpon pusillum (strain Z07020 / HMAS-L-300199) TaxID=1263415 RepID=U1HJF8_ENDPU|nr:uncharacterized protein EPUS_01015 [Endocarpon pusillum Z07020]ERF69059.1 hypothetical protein EPUS_01015 [Endocarpon pusillum Z07020]
MGVGLTSEVGGCVDAGGGGAGEGFCIDVCSGKVVGGRGSDTVAGGPLCPWSGGGEAVGAVPVEDVLEGSCKGDGGAG